MLLAHANLEAITCFPKPAGSHRTEHTAKTLVDGETAVGCVCESWALSAGLCLLDRASLPGRLQGVDSGTPRVMES